MDHMTRHSAVILENMQFLINNGKYRRVFELHLTFQVHNCHSRKTIINVFRENEKRSVAMCVGEASLVLVVGCFDKSSEPKQCEKAEGLHSDTLACYNT